MSESIELLINRAVKNHHSKAIALSDDLAAHPELSNKEYESSRKIVEILSKGGYEVEYPYLGYETAFRGSFDNGDGPSIAILVEYDALPEIGHGCGHNAHGSMSVLAALAMVELKDQFKGKVYVIGTPGEEDDGAKIGMAEKGVFDEMSLAVMMHSWSGKSCIPNMDVLSLRNYIVEFYGQTAHAVAGPWQGRSALAAARKFLDLIDARRECFTPDIHVNAVILDGGRAPNIIPNYAKIQLEFRTDSIAKLEKVNDMIIKCMNGAALALDCEVTKKHGFDDFADMVRVETLEEEMTRILKALGKEVSPVPRPNGSSDMGNASYHCPSIQPLFSITDYNFALHTKELADATTKPKAHEAIAEGADAIVRLCLKVLKDDIFRKEVYDSFIKQRDIKQTS